MARSLVNEFYRLWMTYESFIGTAIDTNSKRPSIHFPDLYHRNAVRHNPDNKIPFALPEFGYERVGNH